METENENLYTGWFEKEGREDGTTLYTLRHSYAELNIDGGDKVSERDILKRIVTLVSILKRGGEGSTDIFGIGGEDSVIVQGTSKEYTTEQMTVAISALQSIYGDFKSPMFVGLNKPKEGEQK